ncbi:MAG: hypothetical protein JXB14_02780, partial [Candidatus Altiarchaeota archaeon]|nr:hypothetical protein [Candidatus Altiarchaeota archaeon]
GYDRWASCLLMEGGPDNLRKGWFCGGCVDVMTIVPCGECGTCEYVEDEDIDGDGIPGDAECTAAPFMCSGENMWPELYADWCGCSRYTEESQRRDCLNKCKDMQQGMAYIVKGCASVSADMGGKNCRSECGCDASITSCTSLRTESCESCLEMCVKPCYECQATSTAFDNDPSNDDTRGDESDAGREAWRDSSTWCEPLWDTNCQPILDPATGKYNARCSNVQCLMTAQLGSQMACNPEIIYGAKRDGVCDGGNPDINWCDLDCVEKQGDSFVYTDSECACWKMVCDYSDQEDCGEGSGGTCSYCENSSLTGPGGAGRCVIVKTSKKEICDIDPATNLDPEGRHADCLEVHCELGIQECAPVTRSQAACGLSATDGIVSQCNVCNEFGMCVPKGAIAVGTYCIPDVVGYESIDRYCNTCDEEGKCTVANQGKVCDPTEIRFKDPSEYTSFCPTVCTSEGKCEGEYGSGNSCRTQTVGECGTGTCTQNPLTSRMKCTGGCTGGTQECWSADMSSDCKCCPPTLCQKIGQTAAICGLSPGE